MNKDHELTVSLEEFGLSKYEARIYVTLISKGTLSASELAYYSEVPRTKVYPILLKLKKKKLVILSKSKPIICTSITPEDAFDGIIHEQINKVNAMNALVTNLKQVSDESRKNAGTEEKRYFEMSSNRVLPQLRTMIKGATSSIKIMADPLCLNLLSECKEQLLATLRRDIDTRIIITPSEIGSEHFHRLPEECKIKISNHAQNCFIFDKNEILLIDSNNGKAAIFSSTEILGSNQTQLFNNIWKEALETYGLMNLGKNEACEVYKIINCVNENGLTYLINSTNDSSKINSKLLKLLEKNGVNLKTKTLEQVLELINSILQITCRGQIGIDITGKNIEINSKLNSGHSLPWATLLKEYLEINEHNPKMIYQNKSKGEKVYIKINTSLNNN